jgi:exopolysaccharide biosynthesis polyprenyl glycosylphosphotransferase
MADDHEQALAPQGRLAPQARLGRRGRVSRPARADPADAGSAGTGSRAGAAVRRLALPVADAAGLTAASLLGGVSDDLKVSALYIAVVLVTLAAGGMHRMRICLRVADQAHRILIATTIPALALVAWLPAARVPWLAAWSGALLLACRGLVCAGLRAAHRRGLLTEPTVIVGAGTFGAYVAGLILEHPELGLRLAGLLDDGPPRLDLPVPPLGRPADLAAVVRRLGIRRVIVCFSSACRDEDLVSVMRASRPLRADVYVVPRLYELGMAVPRGCLDEIWGIPLVPLRSFGHSPAALRLKRVFDLVAGAVLLVVTAPLMLALVVAVRLRTGQAVLFRQARVTGEGRVAPILKLRTLAAHDDPDTRWTAAEHSPLGRWLRATHLDELPQLVNVMRGEMSLVGPRPERPYFSERFSHEVPRYADRTRMPAGLTGWAQVNGLNGDTSIFERARFDNYYAEYWSVWMDLAILARTVAAVISGSRARGAS